jgi:hypothetical protein
MGDTRIPRGRAGFSGSTKQNARYAKLGLPATIKELLNPFTSNVLSGPAPTDSGAPLDPVNHWATTACGGSTAWCGAETSSRSG